MALPIAGRHGHDGRLARSGRGNILAIHQDRFRFPARHGIAVRDKLAKCGFFIRPFFEFDSLEKSAAQPPESSRQQPGYGDRQD